MADIVSVANISELESAEGAEFFFEREKIGKRLAGVELIRERVDHRDASVGGHFFEDFLLVDAGDDAMHPAIQVARDIGDGFARAERGRGLRVVKENDRAAHALDAYIKSDSGAKRRLFENQGDEFSGQRGSVTARAGFDFRGKLEQIARVRGTPFRSGEQIVRQRNSRK